MPGGGHAILVLFDGDVDKVFAELATGADEFTAWYRAQVVEIGGPDLARDEQPASEVIFAWNAS